MRHAKSEAAAATAAQYLRLALGIEQEAQPVGLILGTGWGDVLDIALPRRIPFGNIPGLGGLEALEGHAREVVYGKLESKPVIALRGRIHLNERPADPGLYAMVRLQIEMLLQLGVKNLILTCAAGSLGGRANVGDIVLIDGFVTLFAPEMPMYAGEFSSPEDTIDLNLIATASASLRDETPLKLRRGGHVMLRGPFFEGRKFDKKLLAETGAAVVGMSVLPEACVASLYPDVRVLPLAFVTNSDSEEHSHEENLKRAKEASAHLGHLLTRIVSLT